MLLYAFLSPVRASASLGEDFSSVQNDQAHMNASLSTTPMSGYVLHELRAPNGIVVHEFASASGRIFAVSWQGQSIPDLPQLLGSHFEDFQQAVKSQGRRAVGGALYIQQNGMTVQIGGHMRDIRGRAYLANQLPSGVRVEDLR